MDLNQNYRRAWALNAVGMNMGEQQRSKFSTIDAETIWNIAALLDAHAAHSVSDHVAATHPDATKDAFDAPANETISAVTTALAA